ncbi:hypothetical protein [Acinetobacter indicus]|uniref:hypothetical protein n=1 Tax=Acinetobacter indicus TaxID=756892 RepID=UPI000CEC3839|nr:hypothetical protein [Acinetobacter indicus]
MNLIEQLGGYENARERLKRDNVLSDDDFNYGQRQLLEYRRQHNIFEEGDWVVIPSRGNGIFQVNRLLSRTDIEEMEHAADKEIKAGKRLEVNS